MRAFLTILMIALICYVVEKPCGEKSHGIKSWLIWLWEGEEACKPACKEDSKNVYKI